MSLRVKRFHLLCADCGHRWISAPPRRCPECDGGTFAPITNQISTPSTGVVDRQRLPGIGRRGPVGAGQLSTKRR